MYFACYWGGILSMHTDIPRPIIGLVAEIISEHYTH